MACYMGCYDLHTISKESMLKLCFQRKADSYINGRGEMETSIAESMEKTLRLDWLGKVGEPN